MKRIRENWIQIRVTKEEKKVIERLAEQEGLAVGTFIRKAMLDRYKALRRR